MLCKILGFHGGDHEEYRLVERGPVALVRTDVSYKRIASIIRVERLSVLVATYC
jgi:hypothetical protein